MSEHFRQAELFAARAEEWMDADADADAEMSMNDRLGRRSLDLSAAQVHATLAATATQQALLPKLDAWMALAFKDAPGEEPAS
jgi:hypothetical protein